MLPTKGRYFAHSIRRSINTATKSYSVASPLSEPLDDDVSDQRARQIDNAVKITTLDNGIKVASFDTGRSVSRLKIATNASSRHETQAQLGLSHLMKNAAFLTNNERTSLRTVREALEVGGSLDCTLTREFQIRNVSFLRNKLPEVIENLAPGFTNTIFNPWDVADAKNYCVQENATLKGDHCAVNVELLHKAAYRNGLGNSLYCNDMRLGLFTPEHLDEFVARNFVGNKMTIVGSDISHDELIRYAKELLGGLPKGDAQLATEQKYYGGEVHEYTDNNLTYMSLMAEGAGYSSADLASFVVLRRLLGGDTHVKWGSNTQSSRLTKAAKAVTDGPLAIGALNISYSNSGLFGVNAITTPEAATPVLKAAVVQMNAISKGEISPEDLERAKTQAKAHLNMLDESKEDSLDDVIKQVVFKGSYTPSANASSALDKVTKDNVSQAAKKLLGGKSTLVVTGNTSQAPNLNELI